MCVCVCVCVNFVRFVNLLLVFRGHSSNKKITQKNNTDEFCNSVLMSVCIYIHVCLCVYVCVRVCVGGWVGGWMVVLFTNYCLQ